MEGTKNQAFPPISPTRISCVLSLNCLPKVKVKKKLQKDNPENPIIKIFTDMQF